MRLWHPDRAWGRRGEDLAHRYLRSHGYVVVARNYATRSLAGEVDLIAYDGPVLAFVEVKTRANEDFGSPDRAVGQEKQRRLRIAAHDYARRAGVDWDKTRFDIVSIVLEKPVRITLHRDAFETKLR
ncbi:MAG: YraN family protein [Acidobacteria bacterium]|nr:YraN family protein [Acidobacteriota bacterium]